MEYDKGAKDITRVFFTPSCEKLIYVDKELFDLKGEGGRGMFETPNGETNGETNEAANGETNGETNEAANGETNGAANGATNEKAVRNEPDGLPIEGEMPEGAEGVCYLYEGLPYSSIISKWWQMYNNGQEPVQSNRNTLTFELAMTPSMRVSTCSSLSSRLFSSGWQ